MALYVYNTATGALYSWAPNDTDPVASEEALTANGLSVVTGLLPLDDTHAWDPTTKSVIVVASPVSTVIPTWEFIMLFTPAEHSAIVASTDQKVQQFIMALQASQTVDLSNPIIQGAVSYLVTIGVLTQANATLILSGQPSQ